MGRLSGPRSRDNLFYLEFCLAVIQVLICNGQKIMYADCVGENADSSVIN